MLPKGGDKSAHLIHVFECRIGVMPYTIHSFDKSAHLIPVLSVGLVSCHIRFTALIKEQNALIHVSKMLTNLTHQTATNVFRECVLLYLMLENGLHRFYLRSYQDQSFLPPILSEI